MIIYQGNKAIFVNKKLIINNISSKCIVILSYSWTLMWKMTTLATIKLKKI